MQLSCESAETYLPASFAQASLNPEHGTFILFKLQIYLF